MSRHDPPVHTVVVRVGEHPDWFELRHEFQYNSTENALEIMFEEVAWALWVRYCRAEKLIRQGPGAKTRDTTALGPGLLRDELRLIFDGRHMLFNEAKKAPPPYNRVSPEPSVEFNVRNVPQWWDFAPCRINLGDGKTGVLGR